MIDIEKQIVKQIGIKLTNEDVDGFLRDLDLMFKKRDPEALQRAIGTEYPTLHRIWLDVKQDE